jgi:hypothetical protein
VDAGRLSRVQGGDVGLEVGLQSRGGGWGKSDQKVLLALQRR